MRKTQRVRLEMFGRVQQFGTAYQAQFPEGSPAADAFARLSGVVAAITQDAAARVARTRAGRDQQPSARDALVKRLDAVVRTARVIDRTSPGFAEPFVLPRPKRDDVIRSTTEAFLKEAEPLAARFIARGLPADFIAGLRTALAAYEQATAAKRQGRLERASAVVGIRTAVQQGIEAVDELDVIVRYQLGSNAELQAAWRNARRLDRQATPSSSSTPSTPSAPSTSPSGTPTSKPAVATTAVTSEHPDVIDPAA